MIRSFWHFIMLYDDIFVIIKFTMDFFKNI